jgi:hypothetical protein
VLDALLADAQLAPPLAELAEHGRLARDRRRLNERYLAELRSRTRTPVIELPRLFVDKLGTAHITTLGGALAAQLPR